MEWKSAIDRFETEEIVVIEDFMDPGPLRLECVTRYQAGLFRPAGIGKSQAADLNVRRDQIDWWEPASFSLAQKNFVQKLDLLREAFNREFFLGLHDWEGHFARYGSGDFYQKHVDRFQTDDRRTLSTVFYLNDDWKSEDGGELVVYPAKSAPQAFSPTSGRLVVFLSDRVPHEVKKSSRERLSVAGWFRRRPAH